MKFSAGRRHPYTKALLAACIPRCTAGPLPLGIGPRPSSLGLDKPYVTSAAGFSAGPQVQAASAVNFEILKCETLGLVGEYPVGQIVVGAAVMRYRADRCNNRVVSSIVDHHMARQSKALSNTALIQIIFQVFPDVRLAHPRPKFGAIIKSTGPIVPLRRPKFGRQRAGELLSIGSDPGVDRVANLP